jgi:hypothetical protein
MNRSLLNMLLTLFTLKASALLLGYGGTTPEPSGGPEPGPGGSPGRGIGSGGGRS